MLTIFTTPKPFNGQAGLIQRNAIKSWTLLEPRPEIILFGDDYGVREAAAEFGARHVPEVLLNDYGTPLLNDIFDKAQRMAKFDFLCYSNADIIYVNELMEVLRLIQKCRKHFLMIGQRWDIDIERPIDFSDGWEEKLLSYVRENGNLHPVTGMDYFIFRKGMWREIPPFAIGRTVWDTWLVYSARAMPVDVIDATEAIDAIHQNHDYAHIINKANAWKGPEAERNWDLVGGRGKYLTFTVLDATHRMDINGRLRLALDGEHLKRRLDTMPVLHPRLKPLVRFLNLMLRVTRPLRSALRNFRS